MAHPRALLKARKIDARLRSVCRAPRPRKRGSDAHIAEAHGLFFCGRRALCGAPLRPAAAAEGAVCALVFVGSAPHPPRRGIAVAAVRAVPRRAPRAVAAARAVRAIAVALAIVAVVARIARLDVLDAQLVFELVDKFRAHGWLAFAVEIARTAAREPQLFPRPRDGDIHEPPLLFERGGIVLRARGGHDVLFEPAQEHAAEFQPLDGVDGGDGHIVVLVHLVGVRIEGDLLQVVGERRLGVEAYELFDGI